MNEHSRGRIKTNSEKTLHAFELFVSYSREDARIIKPLVKLLRTLRSVFLDEDTIPPGTKWRFQIVSALQNCETVIVFWCSHAAMSKEVELEYRRAIELNKVVVPILLDATVIPDVLAQYQAIDLRTALGDHETGRIGLPDEWRPAFSIGLRVPSDEELRSAGQYLVPRLYNLMVSR
jgi:hypothetical protein